MTAGPAIKHLAESFRRNATRAAVRWDDGEFTYDRLLEEARRLAGWLNSRGVDSGAAVAIDLPNGPAFVVAYFGCIFGGYRFVPVNGDSSAKDRAYIVARSGAELVLDDPDVVMKAESRSSPQRFAEDGDAGCIFFTSGTTGRPKGVLHDVATMIANAGAFNALAGLDHTVRMHHVLPMGYMAGFLNTLLCPLVAGGTVQLGPRVSPASALGFWAKPLEWEANCLWLTPTIAALLCRLARDPEINALVSETMANIFCGTAPLPDRVRSEFRRVFGRSLRHSYGMSEVLLVSAQTPQQADNGAGSGSLIPGIRVDAREVPGHRMQELVIRSPWVLRCYLDEEGESSPLTSDGAMPTGDTGGVVDGQLMIDGRMRDLIVRGGINISPARIEAVILAEDGVSECAVVGVPDDFWGETVVAWVVASAPGPPDLPERVRHRCRSELGEGMRPDRYEFVAALPKSATGKVQKHQLRAEFAAPPASPA